MAGRGSKWTAVIVPALVTLVIGFLVGRGTPSDPAKQSVKILFPGGGSVEMDVSQREIAHAAVLERLFSEEFTRDGVLGWLARKAIFSVHDERLVNALKTDLCEPIPETPLAARIEKARACASRPVANGLRALAEQKLPPFHYVGVEVRVGVQAEELHRPTQGNANVCRESGFLGKQVALTDPASGAQVVVRASGSYPCTGYARFPDIQLNPEDARALFNRALLEYQKAVAVPLD
jgi:hypothetical protein